MNPIILIMIVTAYCPCSKCCGKWADGRTATGRDAYTRGVAVDRSRIPLGSRLSIPGYGQRVLADDVGGAIKGNRIDVRFNIHKAALKWGRRTLRVTVWPKRSSTTKGGKVKERPILFNAKMVRAVLAGHKTQTRRVIDWKKVARQSGTTKGNLAWSTLLDGWAVFDGNGDADICEVRCPYGKVGDRLWVRETWRVYSWHEAEPVVIQTRDELTHETSDEGSDQDYEEWYERMVIQSGEDMEKAGATINDTTGEYDWDGENEELPTRWRPSIYMPRWCSRINLEIVNIRVERVQDITAEDALAEGIHPVVTDNKGHSYHRSQFMHLWDSINVNRNAGAYSWYKNPWVWVIEFKRIEGKE